MSVAINSRSADIHLWIYLKNVICDKILRSDKGLKIKLTAF